MLLLYKNKHKRRAQKNTRGQWWSFSWAARIIENKFQIRLPFFVNLWQYPDRKRFPTLCQTSGSPNVALRENYVCDPCPNGAKAILESNQVTVNRVTKRELRERVILLELRGVNDDVALDILIEKKVRAFLPDASQEDIERLKNRAREETRLEETRQATARAEKAEKRLQETLAKLPMAVIPKGRPARRSPKNQQIDGVLRQIGEALPKTHKDVFQQLKGRVAFADSYPFKAARGWLSGFKRDPRAARVWLSKQWTRLNLIPFPRGPK